MVGTLGSGLPPIPLTLALTHEGERGFSPPSHLLGYPPRGRFADPLLISPSKGRGKGCFAKGRFSAVLVCREPAALLAPVGGDVGESVQC